MQSHLQWWVCCLIDNYVMTTMASLNSQIYHYGKTNPLVTKKLPQIARFMGPTWGPPGSCRPQMGPLLAPHNLQSGTPMPLTKFALFSFISQRWCRYWQTYRHIQYHGCWWPSDERNQDISTHSIAVTVWFQHQKSWLCFVAVCPFDTVMMTSSNGCIFRVAGLL